MRLRAVDYTGLSDSDLDRAYSVAYQQHDSVTQSAIGVEIVDRLASVSGFAFSLFGQNPFPLYNDIQKRTGGFVASDAAQQSVLTESGNLVTQAEHAAASIGKWAVLGVAGAAVLALLFVFRKK